jgi:hypothetical protein
MDMPASRIGCQERPLLKDQEGAVHNFWQAQNMMVEYVCDETGVRCRRPQPQQGAELAKEFEVQCSECGGVHFLALMPVS